MLVERKTFIVSGGASGLGLATVLTLVHFGAHVAVFDINKPVDLEKFSNRVQFYHVDISSPADIEKAVEDTAEWSKRTGAPLGGVVCCAGVLAPGKIMKSSYEPLEYAKIQKPLEINLLGTLVLIRQVVPHMAQVPESVDPAGEGERGVIIMLSSAAAFDGQPGNVVYAASKGAIRSMTLPLSRDLSRYGIRVVTVAPNMFATSMTAEDNMPKKAREAIQSHYEWPKRAGKPEEFANFVLEICRNRMLNGCCLRLDGAMRLPAKF